MIEKIYKAKTPGNEDNNLLLHDTQGSKQGP